MEALAKMALGYDIIDICILGDIGHLVRAGVLSADGLALGGPKTAWGI